MRHRPEEGHAPLESMRTDAFFEQTAERTLPDDADFEVHPLGMELSDCVDQVEVAFLLDQPPYGDEVSDRSARQPEGVFLEPLPNADDVNLRCRTPEFEHPLFHPLRKNDHGARLGPEVLVPHEPGGVPRHAGSIVAVERDDERDPMTPGEGSDPDPHLSEVRVNDGRPQLANRPRDPDLPQPPDIEGRIPPTGDRQLELSPDPLPIPPRREFDDMHLRIRALLLVLTLEGEDVGIATLPVELTDVIEDEGLRQPRECLYKMQDAHDSLVEFLHGTGHLFQLRLCELREDRERDHLARRALALWKVALPVP